MSRCSAKSILCQPYSHSHAGDQLFVHIIWLILQGCRFEHRRDTMLHACRWWCGEFCFGCMLFLVYMDKCLGMWSTMTISPYRQHSYIYSQHGDDDGVVVMWACEPCACPMIWLIWEVVGTHNLHMVAYNLYVFRCVRTVPPGHIKRWQCRTGELNCNFLWDLETTNGVHYCLGVRKIVYNEGSVILI